MKRNIFAKKSKIEDLLQNIVVEREIFLKNSHIDIWKSAYLSIFGVYISLESQLHKKYWKDTDCKGLIAEIAKTSNKFAKMIHKNGLNHGEWCGGCPECDEIVEKYKKNCIPVIEKMVDKLDDDNNIKEKIKRECL